MTNTDIEEEILRAVSVAVDKSIKSDEMEFPSKAVLSLCQAYATLKASAKR
jgi:hypothetical protein